MGDSSTEVYVFNKRGDKMGRITVPNMLYLETETDWIRKRLDLSPDELDGIALVVDWEKREITSTRYSKDD